MPTYDYECKKCHHVFEVFHGINQLYDKKCPKCDSELKRVISGGSGLIFKGSGFYATDYKKKSNSPTTENGGSKSDTPCSPGETSKCNGCPNKSEG